MFVLNYLIENWANRDTNSYQTTHLKIFNSTIKIPTNLPNGGLLSTNAILMSQKHIISMHF